MASIFVLSDYRTISAATLLCGIIQKLNRVSLLHGCLIYLCQTFLNQQFIALAYVINSATGRCGNLCAVQTCKVETINRGPPFYCLSLHCTATPDCVCLSLSSRLCDHPSSQRWWDKIQRPDARAGDEWVTVICGGGGRCHELRMLEFHSRFSTCLMSHLIVSVFSRFEVCKFSPSTMRLSTSAGEAAWLWDPRSGSVCPAAPGPTSTNTVDAVSATTAHSQCAPALPQKRLPKHNR